MLHQFTQITIMYTYSVCIDPCAVVNSCHCEQKLEAKTENMSVALDAKTINFWILGVYKDVTHSSLWLIQPLDETRVKNSLSVSTQGDVTCGINLC